MHTGFEQSHLLISASRAAQKLAELGFSDQLATHNAFLLIEEADKIVHAVAFMISFIVIHP